MQINRPSDLGEADHLDIDIPQAVRQIGETKHPVLVGGGGELLFSLNCGDGDAGHRQSSGLDGATILGCHQYGCCGHADKGRAAWFRNSAPGFHLPNHYGETHEWFRLAPSFNASLQ